jgi:UV DNA damage endonuclease
MHHLRLGYPTTNNSLRERESILVDRTCRLQTIIDRGVEFAIQLLRKNLDDLMTILKWNEAHGIRFYRISNSLAPHITNPLLLSTRNVKNFKALAYSLDSVKSQLKAIGEFALANGHRLTFHADHYVKLSSADNNIVTRSCRSLYYITTLMRMMNLGPDSVIIVHGGGAYDDKEKAIGRWISVFKSLPSYMKNRICIENDEHIYGIDDVLKIATIVKIPVVLDIFHYRIFGSGQPPLLEVLPAVISSWNGRTIKMHISEQRKGAVIGAHAVSVNTIPKFILELPKAYKVDLDLMVESGSREQNVLFLRKKYQKLGIL